MDGLVELKTKTVPNSPFACFFFKCVCVTVGSPWGLNVTLYDTTLQACPCTPPKSFSSYFPFLLQVSAKPT